MGLKNWDSRTPEPSQKLRGSSAASRHGKTLALFKRDFTSLY